MKKTLIVNVTEIANITYTYEYRYTDNKGITVRVEGFSNIEDLEKDIRSKVRKLSNDNYKIKKVKKDLEL